MPRTAARCTQADLARALRAASQAGGGWAVELHPDGRIRLEKARPRPVNHKSESDRKSESKSVPADEDVL